jgi:membrane-associated phospholipid phosphatase
MAFVHSSRRIERPRQNGLRDFHIDFNHNTQIVCRVMNVEEIIARIRANMGQKIVLSFALSIYFCAAYYLLQRHPIFPVTAIKAIWLDRVIPFVPGTVYLYESIWLLTPIAPWLMKSKAELTGYTQGLMTVSLMGFVVFFLHPTFCPRPNDVHDVNFLYAALIRVDWESNAFPSLHSALAVFHGACCQAVFSTGPWHRRIRWFVWVWVLGIVVSTLLTKQHVFVDSVAGVAVGFMGYLVFCRSRKDFRKNIMPS